MNKRGVWGESRCTERILGADWNHGCARTHMLVDVNLGRPTMPSHNATRSRVKLEADTPPSPYQGDRCAVAYRTFGIFSCDAIIRCETIWDIAKTHLRRFDHVPWEDTLACSRSVDQRVGEDPLRHRVYLHLVKISPMQPDESTPPRGGERDRDQWDRDHHDIAYRGWRVSEPASRRRRDSAHRAFTQPEC